MVGIGEKELVSVASDAVKMRIQEGPMDYRSHDVEPAAIWKGLWWAHKDSNLGPAD